jgi:hypothetical protein
MLFNLNGAAITFCGILVEYALKYTTYAKENPDASFDSSAWDDFEKMTLGPAIVRARKAGLIDEERGKSLRAFKDDLITKDAVFGQVKQKNLETGEGKIVEVPASTSPAFQIIAKDLIDEKSVMKIFEDSDRVVRHLFAMLSRT